MIHDYLLTTIGVLFSVMMLVLLGQKLKIAYPIFLVIAGLLISLAPGMPHIRIHSDLIFLLFLPPILFEAAWFTSWKDFHNWRKQIFSMAFGLVFITSLVVAYVSSSLIPGLTLAMGFLLGGINSPPDAVAATSILKHLKIPKKITSVLEGESLINDASSLIVFKFALAAVMTGQFVMREAVSDFFIMAVGGTAIGLLIGAFAGFILRKMPSNSNIDTVFTLLVPYIVYIVAEHYGFSGVLAVVSAGLFMSYHADCYLSHTSRLQATSVWAVVIFLMNAAVFILIGLELPVVIANMQHHTIKQGIYYAVILSLVIILVRMAYSFMVTYIPWYRSKLKNKDLPIPDWKEPLIISLAAMRGVVSLAAALSIPALLPNGEVFPHRNIILFVTFVTILITLVGQGLLLPWLLRLLKAEDQGTGTSEDKQEIMVLKRIKQASLDKLKNDFSQQIEDNGLVLHYKHRLENEIAMLEDKNICTAGPSNFTIDKAESREIIRALIQEERNELRLIRKEKTFDDTVLRNIENQLDYDEVKITGFQHT